MKKGKKNSCRLEWFLKIIALGFFCLAAACATNQAQASGAERGELGGSLAFLRSHYQGPQLPTESNHYIDLIGNSLRNFVIDQGLTNNHALFILSHGKAVARGFTSKYGLYPAGKMSHVPYYSAKDIAHLLGPAAQSINILVLSSCNVENAFSASEFKRYFVNVTNIIHALPSTAATIENFRQVIKYDSALLAGPVSGQLVAAFGTGPTGPYVGDLFGANSKKPIQRVIAGRELLTSYESLETVSASTNRTLNVEQFARE